MTTKKNDRDTVSKAVAVEDLFRHDLGVDGVYRQQQDDPDAFDREQHRCRKAR